MERFKSIPDNILMFHFVPQLETLQHTDVFITHGGMNSVNESLFYGVPMIVVPQALDQSLVAKRVCELGVGLTIEKRESKRRCITRGDAADSRKSAVQRKVRGVQIVIPIAR